MRAPTSFQPPSAPAIAAYLVVIFLVVAQPAYLTQELLSVTQVSWSLLSGVMGALLGIVQHALLFPFGM